MKYHLTLITLYFTIHFCSAQIEISGIVKDPAGIPIEGANVYLEGTYDGATTDESGKFLFTTEKENAQTLLVSFLSFETYSLQADVLEMKNLNIKLKEDIDALDSVVLNAGSFAAGDNSKASVLTPIDIVTTAGAAGDYIAAFQTLPGTSTVAEDGRLFVRGGDATEANVFIDGLRVFQPFTASTNNIPSRGRFSSFLFKGTNFSTGGYSAEYGDALSSVLLLNTIDQPDQEKTEISVLNVGLGLGNTQKWKNNSLSVNAAYFNLAPYQDIISQRFQWIKPFENLGGEAVYRHQFDTGLLKIYAGYSSTDFEIIQEDIDLPGGIRFKLNNKNTYINATYKGELPKEWKITSGVSLANDLNSISVQQTEIDNTSLDTHVKIKLQKRFSNRFKLWFGGEQFIGNFKENINLSTSDQFTLRNPSQTSAGFAESSLFINKKLAFQGGFRFSYADFEKKLRISPRASLAYKISKHAQMSVAYGDFYQRPIQDVQKFTDGLTSQKATHYLANFVYQHNKRMLRAEAYHKKYDNLITYSTEMPEIDSNYGNDGFGEASGLDVFWRDNQSFKNLEYWLSYSYLDTERKYQNFETEATPNFASTHNLSLVTKYFISDWKSLVGASYNFASGRTYTDPNQGGFLNQKTKSYNSLNFNWAYLISQQKILYFSVSNVLATQNIFNYQYSANPDQFGNFSRRAIRPSADQFFIVGFFWTISEDGKDNQLDDL